MSIFLNDGHKKQLDDLYAKIPLDDRGSISYPEIIEEVEQLEREFGYDYHWTMDDKKALAYAVNTWVDLICINTKKKLGSKREFCALLVKEIAGYGCAPFLVLNAIENLAVETTELSSVRNLAEKVISTIDAEIFRAPKARLARLESEYYRRFVGFCSSAFVAPRSIFPCYPERITEITGDPSTYPSMSLWKRRSVCADDDGFMGKILERVNSEEVYGWPTIPIYVATRLYRAKNVCPQKLFNLLDKKASGLVAGRDCVYFDILRFDELILSSDVTLAEDLSWPKRGEIVLRELEEQLACPSEGLIKAYDEDLKEYVAVNCPDKVDLIRVPTSKADCTKLQ